MRKYLFVFLLLLLSGWRWDTHQNLAETAFKSLPLDVQETLNLSAVREGAIAPDKDFRDNVHHRYPYSVPLSMQWLDEARVAYAIKDYDKASYAFGVASHYISDSFAGPHNINYESSDLHSLFERQVDSYQPLSACATGTVNIEDDLWQAATQGHQDWLEWIENKDRTIPQKETEAAVQLLYKVAHATFNTHCIQPVIVEEKKFSFTPLSITFIVLAALFLLAVVALLVIP